jgi:hypothetical protein
LRFAAFAGRFFCVFFLIMSGHRFRALRSTSGRGLLQGAAHQERPAGHRGGVPGRSQEEDARRCTVSRRPESISSRRRQSRRDHRALKSTTTMRITPISRTVPSVIRHPLRGVAACHLPRSPLCGSLLSF